LLSNEEKGVINVCGVWDERQVRGQTVMGIRRMTSLVDEEGVIQRIWPNVTPDNHAQEILEVVQEAG
jgi:peroxiredoxin Q/BCP